MMFAGYDMSLLDISPLSIVNVPHMYSSLEIGKTERIEQRELIYISYVDVQCNIAG